MGQSALDDRRLVAKRLFDALCEKYPDKYIALIQPRDEPTPPSNLPEDRRGGCTCDG
jgi:hypothetical protein